MYSDASIEPIARICVAALSEAGLTVSAMVRDSAEAVDLALELNRSPTVVRCVERATEKDTRALSLMIAQGDFTRAAIVYTSEDEPHLTGEIEAYPLSRIEELAASLAGDKAR